MTRREEEHRQQMVLHRGEVDEVVLLVVEMPGVLIVAQTAKRSILSFDRKGTTGGECLPAIPPQRGNSPAGGEEGEEC